MMNRNEDHIEPPTQFSDPASKKEYGRELAFNSLLKHSFEVSRKQEDKKRNITKIPNIIVPNPDLTISEASVPEKPSKTITATFPEQKKRGVSKRILLAIAASVAAVTIPLWWPNQSDMTGQNPNLVLTVQSVKGDVKVENSETGEITVPTTGDRILSGDRIVTDFKGRIRLHYQDGTSIQVSELTELLNRINPDNQIAKSLYLKAGRITVNAQKQPMDARMTVMTPSATAEVVGTVFILKAFENHTELIVNEGIVDLKRKPTAKAMKVEAGHIANITPENEKLQIIKPVITSFSLIDIHSGNPLPGYEEILGDALISYNEIPSTGVGIRANISGDTDMVEMCRPDQTKGVQQQQPDKYGEEEQEPEYIGYKAIDTAINPFTVTATPYSRIEGAGTPRKLRVFFDD